MLYLYSDVKLNLIKLEFNLEIQLKIEQIFNFKQCIMYVSIGYGVSHQIISSNAFN